MTNRQIRVSFYDLYGGYYSFLSAYKKDKIAVREDFGFYIDGLCKDGVITVEQYENITL